MSRSTFAGAIVIFLLGVLAGLALAKWVIGASVAIAVTFLVLLVALAVFLLLRRRVREARQPGET